MFTKIVGEITAQDLSSHVFALNEETEGIANLKELADCREITKINLSAQDVTNSACNEQNKCGSKLALLRSKESDLIYGMINAYRMFAEDHREEVRVFTDLQEALSWLAENNLEIESLSKFVNNA